QAGEDIYLGSPIVQLLGDLERSLQVGPALLRRAAHPDQDVAPELPEGLHLNGSLAVSPCDGHGSHVIVEGSLEVCQRLPDTAACQTRMRLEGGILRLGRRSKGLIEHPLGV